MKKYLAILCLFLLPSTANAVICTDQAGGYNGQCEDVASTYNMTMKGFRLRVAGGGGQFVTVSTSTQAFDFAAVGANTALENYITGASIPAGTYDAVSPILSSTISVAGSTTLTGGGSPCRTQVTGTITDGGTAEQITFDLSTAPGINAGTDAVEGASTSADNQYINGDGDFVLIDSTVTGFPITVSEGSNVTFTMSINVNEATSYQYGGAGCTASNPGDLSVSLSASTS